MRSQHPDLYHHDLPFAKADDATQNLNGRNIANVKHFKSMPLAFQELESGGVDAVVADDAVVSLILAKLPSALMSARPWLILASS